MNSTLIWDTARASGIVTLALVSASTVLGLAMSTTLLASGWSAWLVDLHRYLGGLALAFLAVHVGSILLDTYTSFSIVNVLVPFTGAWHPVAVAWGIVALYLLIAVELTSLVRARLPLKLWRSSHYLSFPLFGFSMLHGLTAGTDRGALVLRTACAAIIALVVVLTLLRIRMTLRARGSDEPTSRDLRAPSR